MYEVTTIGRYVLRKTSLIYYMPTVTDAFLFILLFLLSSASGKRGQEVVPTSYTMSGIRSVVGIPFPNSRHMLPAKLLFFFSSPSEVGRFLLVNTK